MLDVPANQVLVARPGIDLPPSSGQKLNPARPYFLFLGGPNPNKNLSVVLDAMAICKELPEELRIAGHWLPKQVGALDIRLSAQGLRDRVRYVGFVPGSELAGLMQEATALIIASLYEGFGLPAGEGLAAGAFVVHSRIPVLEEVSAGAALTFDPESAEDLAACLRRAAGDSQLQKDLRLRGISRGKELTWDAAVETTLTAYRAAMSR